MTSNYCINCWYPLGTKPIENCPDCGYPDKEGENMSLEELIAEYYDSQGDDLMSDIRKSRMIDLLINEYQRKIIKC
jgi:hypothetical protein